MKLKNYELEHFLIFLYDMKLKGKESRMRTRLHKMIAEHIEKVYEPEKNAIIHQYGSKGEDGELILTENKKSVVIPMESVLDFNTEYEEFMNEEYVIEENEVNKPLLLSVGDSLLECDIELNGDLAAMFDNWCERFEETIERYTNKEEM